jgi:signal transduction histidine kinase
VLLGVRAGVAALVLGYLVNAYLFLSPRGHLLPGNRVDAIKVAMYVLSGAATLAVVAWVQRREAELRGRERAAEEKIASQAADLARSNAELERFAEMVAKDLKEPLKSLGAGARRLLEPEAGVGESGRIAALSLERQSRRAMAMVDSLLEVSQAGKRLNIEVVDLSAVLEDVVEDLSRLIGETGGQVMRQRLPAVRCDRTQVTRILKILIANGLLFNASESKRVEIGVAPSPSSDGDGKEEGSAIFVRDNGLGIASENREKIFELFSSNGTGGESGGTGLALVRKLVQSHGGVVWVESRPGLGSTFYFTLGARS